MQKSKRFWEIDFLRGVAIVFMLISNLVTDISYFGIYGINTFSGFWTVLARVTVSMFILLSGISLTLSYSRAKSMKRWEIHKKYLFRGARIFSLGMIITLMTWVFIPSDFVFFGVLHLIGTSIIIGHLFAKYRVLNLLLGMVIIVAGAFLQTIVFGFSWLAWMGFMPQGLSSVDYVPLLPWLGVFLVGMFMGSALYPEGKRKLPDLSGNRMLAPIRFLGRNSLTIYMVHQPVLILALWLLFPFPYQLPF